MNSMDLKDEGSLTGIDLLFFEFNGFDIELDRNYGSSDKLDGFDGKSSPSPSLRSSMRKYEQKIISMHCNTGLFIGRSSTF